MNITIESRLVEEKIYEAKVVEVTPPLNISAVTLAVREHNPHNASNKLMGLLRHLGYKGSFTVKAPEVHYPAIEDAHLEESVYMSSDSSMQTYKVSYKFDRDPQYECQCSDFKFRKREDGSHCKHITRAIMRYDLGIA